MSARVCRDFNSRTCIELSRDGNTVSLIPLEILGLTVVNMRLAEFDKTYKPMADYPIEKAASLYVQYAKTLGASKQAMEALSTLTNVSQEEIIMATTRVRSTETDSSEPVVKGKKGKSTSMFDDKKLMDNVQKEIEKTSAARKAKDSAKPKITNTKPDPEPVGKPGKATKSTVKAPAAKPATTKAVAGKATTSKAVEKSAGKPKTAVTHVDGDHKSASSMFKDLITNAVKLKLTDDAIFAQVQDKFGLDDNKRSYVKWYRKDLAKKGLVCAEFV